ncbi:thiamine diphosphokinase [Loktanella sp. SALINAS62]|uniref:thiamine diphosphokinase n=1 Tax=Loktanella sp. SALINAS62 TaxID=2706124 RepID=UPI001B8C075B|nr:thiamine diphosphokinase [Loktanella sp. SALINAS62]MBS1303916.1 thiamine diphosphokinase [Loktanella sp. SALINAS62]
MKQSTTHYPIVEHCDAITLVGGSELGLNDLNICLTFAPSVVAADGGADWLLDAGMTPLAVIGDMDSLSDRARDTFADLIQTVTDQDTTDFEKCLAALRAPLILAVGFLGARLDHTLATLAAVARSRAYHVVLVSASEVCVLARPGHSQIAAPHNTRVALMPLGDAVVTTAGLVWDMDVMDLAPDGRVSSSNRAARDRIDLTIDGPVLITLEPQGLRGAIDYALGQ